MTMVIARAAYFIVRSSWYGLRWARRHAYQAGASNGSKIAA
jgi:hypothetical protein